MTDLLKRIEKALEVDAFAAGKKYQEELPNEFGLMANARTRYADSDFTRGVLWEAARRKPIEDELIAALKALQFYADGKHWSTTEHEENLFIRINDADWTHRDEGDFVGGKLASEALARLEKVLDKEQKP